MKLLNLEELITEWDVDCKINSTEPSKEIIKIPVLHAKYARQLSLHSASVRSKLPKFNTLKKLKMDYYSGRLDQAKLKELGWQPFGFVLKNDIVTYLDADKELQDEKLKLGGHEECMRFCEMVLKELNSRTWQIKSYMEWEKFVGGQ